VATAEDAVPGSSEPATGAADVEFFEKQVRPLLVARCHECHAGDKHKGNLRLDAREAVLQGGDTGAAIVPGKPDESLLVDAIRYGETYQMPPKGRLPDEEIAVLEDWVRRGAPWPAQQAPSSASAAGPSTFDFATRAQHWCFQPLADTSPPTVTDMTWPRSGIDQFILAGLEARGFVPAAPTDKRTWLRRVTYDLIGLPPVPADIDDFLADDQESAYEKVVDRLLASPHYGERQARHWLDLTRFAETYGHEHDFEIPNAYQYRDYMIRALNADVPYDRLLVEHLAGDLLPGPRRNPAEHFNESIIGTAFFFFGEARHSPVDVREDEAVRVDNQLDVFAKTFLALTLGCARCHDHKFDAITQRDYYALAGYLQSSRYQQAFLDDPPQSSPPETAQPIVELTRLRDRQREVFADYLQQACRLQVDHLAAKLLASDNRSDWQIHRLAEADARPSDVWHAWQNLAGVNIPQDTAEFACRRAVFGTKLVEHQALEARASVAFADFDGPTFGDWMPTGMAFGNCPARAADVTTATHDAGSTDLPMGLVGVSAAHSGLLAEKLQGVLRSPTFTIEHPKIFYRLWGTSGQVRLIVDGLQLIQDPIYGGLKFAPGGLAPHWHEQNVEKWVGHRAYIELIDDGDGWLALDQVVFADQPPQAPGPNALIAKVAYDPTIQSAAELANAYQRIFTESLEWWLATPRAAADDTSHDRCAIVDALAGWSADKRTAPADQGAAGQSALVTDQARNAWAKIKAQRDQICAALPAPRRSLAMAEGTPEDEHVFIRGNHRTLGPEVARRNLQVLGGEQRPAPRNASGRLELAEGLVDGTQPLVPRVMVNRIWQRHFGRGIVSTPDDFGAMGQAPTHPELLDWLAAEFMRQGWSIKALDRLIVLSSAYRMSNAASPAALAADPDNRSWHHVPRRRLDAECIRDAVLAVSGRLDQTMYGPGVAPYLTQFMSGRGRPKESGPLDGLGRRSIYLKVRRNFLSPMLLAFDYPTPFTTIGRRTVSNVPSQALVMLNSPFVAEQALIWAQRIQALPELSDTERVSAMYREALGRAPDEDELSTVARFLAAQRELYDTDSEQHAWADLAHVLFNAKEFVFVE
jgi:hypothetical protein